MTIAASDAIPWPIIIHASSIDLSAVTVGDVLAAVHEALHTLVTEYEYGLVLPNILVTGVMGNRYRNGMKRLDLFGDRHQWAGLSESQEGPENGICTSNNERADDIGE
ncbi:hypothetical protein BD779DRAFT_1477782 [Infundibulicybe gibba]|nr:hypothetical protein BD779DRAFT_1477782 [Infundibulicybe gibba]